MPELPGSSPGLVKTHAAQRWCRRREVVGRVRRSKNGPEPSARGNFTPPPRGAAPAPVPGSEPTAPPAPSGSRLSPRNWRVPTRLNAILLIPVLVGLVMGGFQVKSSIDTWQEAQDAEKIAQIVGRRLGVRRRPCSTSATSPPSRCSRATARTSSVVEQVRATTDEKADAFHEAVEGMPVRAGPGAPPPPRGGGRADARRACARPRTPTALDPVKTEEGYVDGRAPSDGVHQRAGPRHRQHHQLRPHRVRRRAGQGRRVAAALDRHAPAGQAQRGRDDMQPAAHRVHLVRLPGEHRRPGVHLRRYGAGRRASSDGHGAEDRGGQAAGRRGRAAGRGRGPRVRGPARDGQDDPGHRRQEPRRTGHAGHHPATWMAASTAKFDGYDEIEADLIDTAVAEARTRSPPTPSATPSSTARSSSSPCSPRSSSPRSWPAR